MNTGITRIEGVIVGAQKNNRRFSILQLNGESITYTITQGMEHMMKGIENGVNVLIDSTISGPKSIVTYPIIAYSNEEVDTSVSQTETA